MSPHVRSHALKLVMLIVVLVTAAATLSFWRAFSTVRAGNFGNLSGYAWSDNIGWISFSGTNYGVTVDSSGNLGNYAWSDNVGWISFNAADVQSCVTSYGGTAGEMVAGRLQGWAKAVAADNNGWDGCISLSGSSPSYGPAVPGGINQTGTFDGYVWGSSVVGWISFNCNTGGPTGNNICATSNYNVQVTFQSSIGGSANLGFTADPSRVQKGKSTYLTWNASTMASCSGVTDQNGNVVPGSAVTSGTNVPAAVNQATVFTLTCCDSNKRQYTASANVSIVPIYQAI